jgi:hypothetical protein
MTLATFAPRVCNDCGERSLEATPQVHGQERVRSKRRHFTIGHIEMEPATGPAGP